LQLYKATKTIPQATYERKRKSKQKVGIDPSSEEYSFGNDDLDSFLS
jgi:hypothetical protein